ncbi:hypothetical protein CEP54_002537 [Fusarium duplospermum]|uniref:Uncharacterized protein n=1 Tax=Fusarium duplospermum TaxID=1325734 RepID=A0A428QUH1_9HYPO|nr:hypothetical protein CEP54_002537 [Fusarium duplospermum]
MTFENMQYGTDDQFDERYADSSEDCSRGLTTPILNESQVLMDPVAQARITNFRVDASADTLADVQTPGLSMRLFDFISPPFTFWLATSFSMISMTKFSIVLSNGREHPAGQELLNQGQVGSILAAMPGPTDLSIEGHNFGLIGAILEVAVFESLKRVTFFCGPVLLAQQPNLPPAV